MSSSVRTSKSNRTNLSRKPRLAVPLDAGSSSVAGSRQSSRKSTPKPSSSKRSEMRQERHLRDDLSDVSDDDLVGSDNYTQSEVDDEPRFKYSTAGLADNSPRNTKFCIAAMCVLCIILAIGLSVMLAKLGNSSDEDDAASSVQPTSAPGANVSSAGVGLFTSTLETVNIACSSPGDPCAETCSDFGCCDPMLNDKVGCFFGNREGCLTYARCHVSTSGIDPPSDTLDVVCAKSRVANDPSACEAACQGVKCCWEDESSCKDNAFYACVDYAICQNLRGLELEVHHPADSLRVLCDSSLAGGVTQKNECDVACAPAACCWDSSSENCLRDNFFTCLKYEPCGQLDFPEAFTEVPDPGVDTSLVCSSTYRAMNGASECEAACNLATCCHADPGESCFVRDPLGCIKYDGCRLLELE